MWIDVKISPLRKGNYRTLVDVDGLGALGEYENEYFDGEDWCHFKSNRQFIRYWKAEPIDYKEISEMLNTEYENYLNKQNK